MTDDELEQEREALLAEIDVAKTAGKPLTEDVKQRVAALAAADMARPKPPLLQALRVLLDEAAADHPDVGTLPKGLNIRDLNADPLEVVTQTGEVFTRIPKASLIDVAQRLTARLN